MGEMAELAERIEEELTQAFEVKDRNALRRYARLIEEHTVDRPTFAVTNDEVQRGLTVLQGDLRVLAETIKQGLAFAEKRRDIEMLILQLQNGELRSRRSSGFAKLEVRSSDTR